MLARHLGGFEGGDSISGIYLSRGEGCSGVIYSEITLRHIYLKIIILRLMCLKLPISVKFDVINFYYFLQIA